MWHFAERIVGAFALDAQTYEEVEADRSAIFQALIVVLLASVATGIGFLRTGESWPAVIALHAAGALIGWVVWALIIYGFGVYAFPAPQTRSSVGELLRTTGFASAPALADGPMLEETMTRRLLPGEGATDWDELARVFGEIGARPIIAPEPFNRERSSHGPTVYAHAIAEATRRLLVG